jgi:hypothetical protein
LDGFMNVAMEQAEEFVEGSLKSKLGDCFIRGNNGKLRKGYNFTSICAGQLYLLDHASRKMRIILHLSPSLPLFFRSLVHKCRQEKMMLVCCFCLGTR